MGRNGSDVRVGIEYESTMKTHDRYSDIRKSISGERDIHGILYFTAGEAIASIVLSAVYSRNIPVGVLLLEEFKRMGENADVRLSDGHRSITVTLSAFISTIPLMQTDKTPPNRQP
jgi:hypothetical protein